MQLARIRNMRFFSSLDLLSEFNYLVSTLYTGNGKAFYVHDSIGGSVQLPEAPQGWCNTPSLFTMCQIHEVLQKVGAWSENSM
eukprot:snap_masked-scaffold_11-processed-gene-10.30-mRNA-1 protein AED:1.00 eAED:1.00 QI:0/-1/0/0/-1/1/1/0/82